MKLKGLLAVLALSAFIAASPCQAFAETNDWRALFSGSATGSLEGKNAEYIAVEVGFDAPVDFGAASEIRAEIVLSSSYLAELLTGLTLELGNGIVFDFDRFEVGTKYGTDKTLIPSDESVIVTFAAAEHKEMDLAGCDTARLVFTYGIGAKKLANSDKITVRNVYAELPTSPMTTPPSPTPPTSPTTDPTKGPNPPDGDNSPSMTLYVFFMATCAGGIVALRLKRK